MSILPADRVVLRRHPDRMVLMSPTNQAVYRITLQHQGSSQLSDPSDTGYSHRIAWAMASAGLNVLTPLTPEPLTIEGYAVSTYPLAEGLELTGWFRNEPEQLGAELAAWRTYTNPALHALDIPAYSRARSVLASNSSSAALRAAGRFCLNRLDREEQAHPWDDLMLQTATVHGDPHLGNVVRLDNRLLFIDLDTVKIGPEGFDLAVMQQYVARYGAAFPASQVIDGYQRDGSSVDSSRLDALMAWKSLSSLTQLLTRWSQDGIPAEFHRRVRSQTNWGNVTNTPMVPRIHT
ncbi:phosphotransferase [Kribbella sp. NPDC051718]|uniref:phosphotransferase n=1 Tax=Kribbella sp. NPDC051718 TaxID=3155168 RepID=UPI0034283374